MPAGKGTWRDQLCSGLRHNRSKYTTVDSPRTLSLIDFKSLIGVDKEEMKSY